ncbi:hypothetical protein [Candidatus Nitronereus thalassa]|uniref:SGNH hydrolase-type esterase domain-containing protein n=1 Tax=Candidatus Nitronereus thalassa TaxID=3020898 RepID=A0ABU3K3R0_9BACT|nr:hypothetical protein [Candidatus Nitronereus thalassa]MDT7041023.1 hypothetical protein [Candidatus Nitronereus thalassa]
MSASPQKSWIRRHPKTTIVVTVLFFTLFFDLVGTGIYHLAKYGTLHKYEYLRVMRIKDPVFHHTLKPEAEYTLEKWGGTQYILITNSLGFKDRQVRDVPLESASRRVLFIGDSFTEGVGYGYDQTFVGRIDIAFADRQIEVLNAGVASYSPIMYYAKVNHLLKTVGLKFDDLVVFLDISDIHDETGYELENGQVIPNAIPSSVSVLRGFFFEYTMIPRNIWSTSEKLCRKFVKDPDSHPRSKEDHSYGTNTYRSLWTIEDSIYEAYGEEGLQRSRQHMNLLYQLLKDHGITMTVAVYPQPDQILHHDLDSRQVKFWQAWAREHSVPFLNFFPDFIQEGQDPKEAIRKYFIPGDLHWNDEGHRLITEKFLERWQPANPLDGEAVVAGAEGASNRSGLQ